MKKIPVIPECYKTLPGHTLLNSKDMAKIFGYKNTNSVIVAYQNGSIPEPSESFSASLSGHPNKSNYWKLSTVRNWGKDDN